jgi:hypothetical protein
VEHLLAVLVDATTEHPFPVTVTVPVKGSAQFLADISDGLDRSGLLRGDHWSLSAAVEDPNVHLRFALESQASVDRLHAIVRTLLGKAFSPKPEEEHAVPGIGGPVSGRFLNVFRIPKDTLMEPAKSKDSTDA